jgi:hypothetical protein
MDSALSERIKRIYPAGVLWERADEPLSANEQYVRIDSALGRLIELEAVRVSREPRKIPSYQFAITGLEDPPFDAWVWHMGNAEKLNWIACTWFCGCESAESQITFIGSTTTGLLAVRRAIWMLISASNQTRLGKREMRC